MKKGFLIILIGVLLPLVGLTQKNTISGMLIDSDQGKLLAGAHVVAKNAKKKRYAVVSDGRGMFQFKPMPDGEYTLTISYVGMDVKNRKVTLQGMDVDLGVIKLNEKKEEVEEIAIVARMPQATMVGDTTQYNAAAFKTNPDADAGDLIEKMPGVVVDNGTVQAQGEDVEEVTVDGKPFFGKNPTATLQTLPADVVDKIQIFDKQSEQSEFTGFNDGETTKTINIITKEEMRNSTFGKVYSGYGTDNRYLLGGNLNFFKNDRRISVVGLVNNVNQQNFTSEDLLGVSASGGGGRTGGGRPGKGGPPSSSSSSFLVDQDGGISNTQSLGLNFSDSWGKKMEVSGSYFFNHSTNSNNSSLTRTYISAADSGMVYNENTETETENANHRFNLKFEYDINDNNSLLIVPSLSIQQNEGSSLTLSDTYLEGSALDKSSNYYESDLTGMNFSNFLLYRHKFNKTGRTVSLMVNTTSNTKEGDSKLFTESEDADTYSLTNQEGMLDRNNFSLTSNLMYTEPLGKNSLMRLGYKTNYQDNSITSETFDFDSVSFAYSSVNPLLSNTSENGYFTQEAEVGFMSRSGMFMFNGDIDFQLASLSSDQLYPNEVKLERNYKSILPKFHMMASLSRNQKLILGYRTNTNNPDVEDLQEVVDNSDPYQLTTGNPELDQSYQHSMFMRYSNINSASSRVFYLMLMGNYTNDYIGNNIFYSNRDTLLSNGLTLPAGGQISMPENMDGYVSLRSFATYGLPLYRLKTNMNINLSGSYMRTPGIYNGLDYHTETNTLSAGLVLSSNISEYVDFTLSTTSNYSKSKTDLAGSSATDYLNQVSKAKVSLMTPSGIKFTSDIAHQYYSGMSDGYNESYFLWNVGIGKKFLKNNAGELRLNIYDLLDQNQSITRTVNDFYVEDSRTEVLQRYFMLSFIYTIKSYKGSASDEFKS